MKQKLLEMVQVTVLFHTDEFIFVWSFKNGTRRQNRSPRVPKLGYFVGQVPKLSSRVTLTSHYVVGRRGLSCTCKTTDNQTSGIRKSR